MTATNHDSRVFIAGVGCSEIAAISSLESHEKRTNFAITAATKALLDAGITYSEVDQSIACHLDDGLRVPKTTFDAFGMTGAGVSEVDAYSSFFTTIQCIRSGRANCALLIGFDQEPEWMRKDLKPQGVAVAAVLVSVKFLTSHAYLKDAAVQIRASAIANPIWSREKDAFDEARTTKMVLGTALEVSGLKPTQIQILEMRPKSNLALRHAFGDFRQTDTKVSSKSLGGFSGSVGLAGLSELVWQLRGWAGPQSVSQAKNALQYTIGPEKTCSAIILSRADGKTVPRWKAIEHLRDGRERLGYNPAVENKPITIEDWQAVKADDAYLRKDVANNLSLESRGGDAAALARLQPQAKL